MKVAIIVCGDKLLHWNAPKIYQNSTYPDQLVLSQVLALKES